MTYTHVTTSRFESVQSPVDRLSDDVAVPVAGRDALLDEPSAVRGILAFEAKGEDMRFCMERRSEATHALVDRRFRTRGD